MAEHIPTSELRAKVAALASFGIVQTKIAKYINISVPTLTKHYEMELELAKVDKIAAVANALFKNATEKGNVTAQIFWLKTQAGWRENESTKDDSDGRVEKIQIEVIGKGEVR